MVVQPEIQLAIYFSHQLKRLDLTNPFLSNCWRVDSVHIYKSSDTYNFLQYHKIQLVCQLLTYTIKPD